ncbi:REP element-mobilizing transposase RayT [Anaerobacterium chartisolvens]|uniref:REP element-mobilizing transposase RayT n=1 Tax=Anaerobacterium chartisolvens TaxID=1297424 RepID=A0A369ADG6_9FIRM|nr:transposase [Anaerobacterium chartisolvens]RCX07389.1 REP element-mobilizing transposase RayT [Anaerobacterium chartisolvens]
MPRQARVKGEFSTYHVIHRGNERKNIFLCDSDKLRFLETLERMKSKYGFLVHAYCIMDNHVHLLINDNGNDISQIIKSINISYAYYFNHTYKRCGHLFQDRFKSERVDDDNYLLEVSRYIHNNPVKAGMASDPSEYKWSSCGVFTGSVKDSKGLVDKGRILDFVSNNRSVAVRSYIEYVTKEEDSGIKVMDIEEESKDGEENNDSVFTLSQAKKRLEDILSREGFAYEEMLSQIKLRDELMKEMRRGSSLTLKELGKLFGGISESRVSRILSKK